MTTLTVQQNVNGYTGTTDTYIRGSKQNTSYINAATVFSDGSDSSGAEIQGLLSFSNLFGNGPGQIPLGSTITSATLTVNMSDGTNSPIRFFRMATDWTTFPALTWNAFGGGIQTNGTEALTTADVTLSGAARGNVNINVLTSLQAWASGASNFGWMLASGGSDGFEFSSAQGTSAPILTVTYEAPVGAQKGISLQQSGGTTVVVEGGADDTLVIALTAAPTSDVTITIFSTGPDDISIPVSTLTFTSVNWATQQTVILSAIDDALIEAAETYSITVTASSLDTDYQGMTGGVGVIVGDNDTTVPEELSPYLVAVRNASLYTAGDPTLRPGCGDPSGIAYVPGLDVLYIVDSEHDESPYFSPNNLFVTTRDGTFLASFSMASFTREPTGIAYNPFNGYLYISDDDARRIFVVDPNNPTVALGSIDVRPMGYTDAEDPEIDPVTGHIYFLNGLTRKLVELSATGTFVGEKTFDSVIADPEAMAYDPSHDVFYIAGGATRGVIYQVDRDGHVLDSFDLLNSSLNNGAKPKIKGLELAPSSDPNDGDRMSLYAVDYGADQKMDGRWFEIDLYHDWLGA